MEKKECLKYSESESFDFSINEGSFVTFFGDSNNKILNLFKFNKKQKKLYVMGVQSSKMSLDKIYKVLSYILNRDLDIFVAETVEDEIAFGLEGLCKTRNQIREVIIKKSREFGLEELLKRSPNSLGSSDKAKLKILSSLIYEPKILILDNILSEIDYGERLRVISLLKEYVNKGNVILNFTSDIEESLIGDRIIIGCDNKIVADGNTMAILKEEKLMKKLGFGLPFIVELNKYFIDYGITSTYEIDMERLVNSIWK